jgi:CelD/BcsL family acetyltransferase involved in cellulose biosynthesis
MTVVQELDVEDVEWAAFVAAQSQGTCFVEPAWVQTIARCYRYKAFVLVQRGQTGRIVAGIPLIETRRPTGQRRWVSLPFSDECSPLVSVGGSAEDLVRMTDSLRRQRGVAALQVRTALPLELGVTEQVAVTHTLTLPGADGSPSAARPRASVRRHVATARRLGVVVRFADTAADLVNSYYGLHVRTRRRQGVPSQPRRYFRLLWEQMIAPGHGFVLLATSGSRTVAGAVYLLGRSTVTYKYGASDKGSWSLHPNHAVMSTAIAWAADQGYGAFDFGRTDLDNPELMRFKESWGAVARPLRYTYVPGAESYGGTRKAAAVLSPLIRHSPDVVCRGIGELMYRYAG